MFGLFKKRISVVAVGKVAMTGAALMPSEVENGLGPFNLPLDALFNSEVVALAYVVTILGILGSDFGTDDAARICVEFDEIYTAFIAKQLSKNTGRDVSLTTEMLSDFFQDRYDEYRSDVTAQAMASVFLQKLGQVEIHPTTLMVMAALVFTGLKTATQSMTSLAKEFRLR